MRLERATISLEPRTVAGCADLAGRFVGEHPGPIVGLWLAVTVPTLVLMWVLYSFGLLNLWGALAVAYFASSPLGVLIGLATIPTVFGEALRGPSLRHRILTRGPKLILEGLAFRFVAALAGFLCLLPAVWVAVKTGFFVEQACLAKLEDRRDADRVRKLVQSDFSELMSRALVLGAYGSLLWLVVFVTVDVASGTVFQFPILTGRLFAGGGLASFEYAVHLVYRDPAVLMTTVATGLAIYALGRIAWFFCYVDLRVRRDLWDVELKLSREAKRLEGMA